MKKENEKKAEKKRRKKTEEKWKKKKIDNFVILQLLIQIKTKLWQSMKRSRKFKAILKKRYNSDRWRGNLLESS